MKNLVFIASKKQLRKWEQSEHEASRWGSGGVLGSEPSKVNFRHHVPGAGASGQLSGALGSGVPELPVTTLAHHRMEYLSGSLNISIF